jgi:hypothetical protein
MAKQTLDNFRRVVEALRASDAPLTVASIVKRTSLSISQVHTIACALTKAGYTADSRLRRLGHRPCKQWELVSIADVEDIVVAATRMFKNNGIAVERFSFATHQPLADAIQRWYSHGRECHAS